VKKWIILAAVAIVIALFIVLNLTRGGSKVEVQTTEVKRRDITKTVSASGAIQAKQQLDVSATAIGKITALAVSEGDVVTEGDFLLEIDPTAYESVVDQLEASIGAAGANLEMERASLEKAEYDLRRVEALFAQELVSEEELKNARYGAEVSRARVRSAEETLSQHRANLRKARHELREVRITAEMSGTITTLNVEEGESAIMGTLNNPGTVLLTISDLSEIEAEVLVDETEVVYVEIGQPARITLDAFPDTPFKGVVTEVGNSAVRSQVGLGQTSVDFKVVVSVRDTIPDARPGLSASVEIDVAEAHAALSIPIQCLTLRRTIDDGETQEPAEKPVDGLEVEGAGDGAEEVEGVFVVEEGRAIFKPVEVGIAGSSYFEVLAGLEEGAAVVSGPFKAINELEDGDPVKISAKKDS
jgi:HlyD family secretion protein